MNVGVALTQDAARRARNEPASEVSEEQLAVAQMYFSPLPEVGALSPPSGDAVMVNTCESSELDDEINSTGGNCDSNEHQEELSGGIVPRAVVARVVALREVGAGAMVSREDDDAKDGVQTRVARSPSVGPVGWDQRPTHGID